MQFKYDSYYRVQINCLWKCSWKFGKSLNKISGSLLRTSTLINSFLFSFSLEQYKLYIYLYRLTAFILLHFIILGYRKNILKAENKWKTLQKQKSYNAKAILKRQETYYSDLNMSMSAIFQKKNTGFVLYIVTQFSWSRQLLYNLKL